MAREDTRNRIVDVTADIILEKGYDGARTRDIAAKSGVSEATVFKYFSSKEELMKHLITSMVNKFTSESRIIIGRTIKDFSNQGKASFKELLKSIITERINYFMTENKLLKIIVREMLVNQALKKLFIDTIYNNFMGIMEVIIVKGIEAGEFRKTALKTLKDTIFGVIIYNTVINSVIDDSFDKSKAKEMTDILINGITA